MSKNLKQDNSTEPHKVALRRQALSYLEADGVSQPIVMETHGGNGVLFDRCYAHIDDGIVFEKQTEKVERLARQRPCWAVYEGDCVNAIAAGAGRHFAIDLLDIDPYGTCWETVDAFFSSQRSFAPTMYLVVNDGLRQKLASNSGWEVKMLEPMVLKYGNNLHRIYKEIAQELLGLIVEQAGYSVVTYHAYYCGHSLAMLHFLAKLERK